MMVIYEITSKVLPELVKAYQRYMREQHIPDLIETRHFSRAEFAKSEDGTYCVRYFAHSRADMDEYLRANAECLRADFLVHFPTGIEVTRKIYDVIETWDDIAVR
jgi:hypothetical protein